MAAACPIFVTLNTGAQMPILGFGTWQAAEGELEEAVEEAMCAGYRHFDSAAVYGSEHVLGNVITDSWIKTDNVKREELFITTKLPPSGMRPEGVERFLTRSLAFLKMDYVDMYLIHVPMGFQDAGEELHPTAPDGTMLLDLTTDHVAIWKAMEDQVDAGRAKAIGLSNFNEKQIQRILDNCRIKPANLQIELHLYMQQKPLVEFCNKNDIVVTAYSPLGSPGTKKLFAALGHQAELPNIIAHPVVLEIAEKNKITAAQVLLRHIIQKGIVTIPKSVNQKRIIENIQLFNFELSPEDVETLDALDQGEAGRILDFEFFKGIKNHPEYPFHPE